MNCYMGVIMRIWCAIEFTTFLYKSSKILSRIKTFFMIKYYDNIMIFSMCDLLKTKMQLLISRGCQYYIHYTGKITTYWTSNKTCAYLWNIKSAAKKSKWWRHTKHKKPSLLKTHAIWLIKFIIEKELSKNDIRRGMLEYKQVISQ